jgi:hypothetical protein
MLATASSNTILRIFCTEAMASGSMEVLSMLVIFMPWRVMPDGRQQVKPQAPRRNHIGNRGTMSEIGPKLDGAAAFAACYRACRRPRKAADKTTISPARPRLTNGSGHA